jgi:NAD-dependent dihydropyrimidine dehydrogenase PreA subunit
MSLANISVDYESLHDVGGILGSGGFVVIGEDRCTVDTALYFARFAADESCGRCRACREGSAKCVALLERITAGEGGGADLQELQAVAEDMAAKSLCGLGKSTATPILTSLKYFADEYQAHLDGRCPGLTCQALIRYEIIPERCQGERCCLQTCPGNAIKGRFGKAGTISERLCQKCGMCMLYCPYAAVRIVS